MSPYIDMLREFWINLQQGQVLPLGIWSYVLLMILIIIQGPISTMLGGAVAAAGMLNPFGVLAVAMVGNLGADAFWYSMGYTSKFIWRIPFFSRYRQIVDVFRSEMERHAFKVLLMAKLSVGMALPAVVAAGMAHVPWRKWFPAATAGEFIWTGSLLLIGYFATKSIIGAEWVIMRLGIAVSVILFLVMVLFVMHKLQQQRWVG